MTTATSLEATQHAANSAADAGKAEQSGGSAQSGVPAGAVSSVEPKKCTGGRLVAFEGFLKRAGHTAGVVLSDLVKYAMPIAQMTALLDPALSPETTAFTASVRLVQTTVLSAQQRWANEGTAANTQKLADVLTVVEQPIILLFAQAGLKIDVAYVVNLVNGVVALLNAQPAGTLASAEASAAVA